MRRAHSCIRSSGRGHSGEFQQAASAEGLHLEGAGQALHSIADLLDCYGDGLELSASQQAGLFHAVGIIADMVKRTGEELSAAASAPEYEHEVFGAAPQAAIGA